MTEALQSSCSVKNIPPPIQPRKMNKQLQTFSVNHVKDRQIQVSMHPCFCFVNLEIGFFLILVVLKKEHSNAKGKRGRASQKPALSRVLTQKNLQSKHERTEKGGKPGSDFKKEHTEKLQNYPRPFFNVSNQYCTGKSRFLQKTASITLQEQPQDYSIFQHV